MLRIDSLPACLRITSGPYRVGSLQCRECIVGQPLLTGALPSLRLCGGPNRAVTGAQQRLCLNVLHPLSACALLYASALCMLPDVCTATLCMLRHVCGQRVRRGPRRQALRVQHVQTPCTEKARVLHRERVVVHDACGVRQIAHVAAAARLAGAVRVELTEGVGGALGWVVGVHTANVTDLWHTHTHTCVVLEPT